MLASYVTLMKFKKKNQNLKASVFLICKIEILALSSLNLTIFKN